MVRIVRESKMSANPHNDGNSHINLHVSWMTLGSPGARSSPLGFLFLSPKELRITGFISQTLVILRKYIIIFPWVKPSRLAPFS
jgi:hypothetical protein